MKEPLKSHGGGPCLGEPEMVARVVTSFDAPVIWIIQPDNTIDQDFAEAIRSSMPTAAGELRCRLLVALNHESHGHEPIRIEAASSEALEIARGLGDPELICMALNARYRVLNQPRRRAELELLGHEMLELSARSGLLGYQTFGHFALVMVNLGRCGALGRFVVRFACGRDAESVAREEEMAGLHSGSITLGPIAYTLGRLADHLVLLALLR